MKILEVNTYLVRPRWCFVEIVTDSGISGWGEAVLEGKAATVSACVGELKSLILGADPMNIEDIWQMLYRAGFYRGGGILMSAISGIDQALWDIKGKFFGVPSYELLGGACHDKVRVYSGIGGSDKTAEETAKVALSRKEEGFTAVKLDATKELHYVDSYDKIDTVLERVAAVRQACGKDFGIAIDLHGRVHKPMAKILAKKLEEFDLMFIEEPVLCDNMELFPEIARSCNLPIATGERLYSRWDFKRLLNIGGVDIIQPDLSHAGGLTEVKKIASMAEAYDVALAPHCPLGPLAFASCLNIDACCHNAIIQEQTISIYYNVERHALDYVHNKEDLMFTNGFANLPKLAGLGVDIKKELVLEENKTPHSWKNPVWRQEDGSIAEW